MSYRARLVYALVVLMIALGMLLGVHYMTKHSGCIDGGGGNGFFQTPNCYTMNGGAD